MIAILLLTYNNLESTKKCIEKLYKHTKSNFLLFILDNNSTDGTVEYLHNLQHKNITVYLSENNKGIIDGRNYIYEVSKGDNYKYAIFLDNDQFVKDGWDENYLRLMEEYDIVGQEAWQMRQSFQPIRRIKNESELFDYVGCGGMMIKREVIEDIGLFDASFNPKYYEDPDFCFRAVKNGYKVGWSSSPVIEHQKHDLTLSSKERVFFMRNLKIIQNRWRDFPLPRISMKGCMNE